MDIKTKNATQKIVKGASLGGGGRRGGGGGVYGLCRPERSSLIIFRYPYLVTDPKDFLRAPLAPI